MRCWMLVLVALAGLSAPAPAAAVDLSQTCVNPHLPFAVRFPTGWWAHPADPSREIAACEYLGPVPFTLTNNEDGVLVGGTITMFVAETCVGGFLDVVSQRDITVAGQPTIRIEFAASEADPTPGPATALVYWIHLYGQECNLGETSYVVASTGSDDPEAYAANAAVLDAMMATFALGTVPDGAMDVPEAGRPNQWFGVALLVAGMSLMAMRHRLRARQPKR